MELQQQYIDQVEIFQQKPVNITGPELTQPPHCYIGAIFSEKKNQSSDKIETVIGTGTLISPDLVLTAAHNLFSKAGTFHKNVKFYLPSQTGISEHYHEVEDVRIPEQFKTVEPDSKLTYDYGVIKLKKPIKFDQFPSLIYLCQTCLSTNDEIWLSISGYPSKYQPVHGIDIKNIKRQIKQYGLSRQGRVLKVNIANNQIRYSISTYPGQSGCPVMIEKQIIAVHTGGNKGYNIGRIIEPVLMSHLYNWVEELNASQFDFKGNMSCLHHYIDNYQQIQDHSTQDTCQIPQEKPHKVQEYDLKEIGEKQLKDQIKNDQKEKNEIRQNQQSISNSNSLKIIDLSQYQKIRNLSACQLMHKQKKLSCCSFVKNLKLKGPHIQQIDFNPSPETTHLNLSNNKIYQIFLSPFINLQSIDLSNNCIKSINFKNNFKLTSIRLQENPIHSIDVSYNKELQELIMSKTNISYIDLKNNKKLTNLQIKASYLKSINLAENINLKKATMCSTNLQNVFITFSNSLWSNSTDYNFYSLKSKACRIVLKVESEESIELAKYIAEEWEDKYSKQKCRFQVTLEK